MVPEFPNPNLCLFLLHQCFELFDIIIPKFNGKNSKNTFSGCGCDLHCVGSNQTVNIIDVLVVDIKKLILPHSVRGPASSPHRNQAAIPQFGITTSQIGSKSHWRKGERNSILEILEGMQAKNCKETFWLNYSRKTTTPSCQRSICCCTRLPIAHSLP